MTQSHLNFDITDPTNLDSRCGFGRTKGCQTFEGKVKGATFREQRSFGKDKTGKTLQNERGRDLNT